MKLSDSHFTLRGRLGRELIPLLLFAACVVPVQGQRQPANPAQDGLEFNRFSAKTLDTLAPKAGGPTERIEVQSTEDHIDYVVKAYNLENANAAEIIEVIQISLNLEEGNAQAFSTGQAGEFLAGGDVDAVSVSRSSGWKDVNVSDFRRFPEYNKADSISILVVTMPLWMVPYMDDTIAELDRADFSAYDDGEVGIHVRPKYRLPTEIAQLIADSVAGDFTVLIPDDSRQLLYIRDLPSYLSADLEAFQIFDQPALQIETRVRIVEVQDSDVEDIGIDWNSIKDQIAGGGLRAVYGSGDLPTATVALNPITGEPSLSVTPAATGSYDLELQSFTAMFALAPGVAADVINLLVYYGKATVLTDARLRQVNGETATLESVSIIPYVVRAFLNDTQLLGNRQDVPTNLDENSIIKEYREGVVVEMTPRISDDIEIEISVMIATMIGRTPNQLVPIVNENTVRTTLLLSPDQPAVMGGLIRENEVQNEKKVWGLGHIPILGKAFFTHKVASVRRSMIVIIIEMERRASDGEADLETESAMMPGGRSILPAEWE